MDLNSQPRLYRLVATIAGKNGNGGICALNQFRLEIALVGTGTNDSQCPVSARCSCHRRQSFQRLDVSFIRAHSSSFNC